MAEYSKLYTTNKGKNLIAKMLVGTVSEIDFVSMVTSNTQYDELALDDLTALTGIQQTSLISNKKITNETAIELQASFTNTDLDTGYYMRTIGLYAKDPDEGEILFAVTVEKSGNCYMPPCNGAAVSGVMISLVTTVGNAESVSLTVDQAAIATIKDIKALQKEMEGMENNFLTESKDVYVDGANGNDTTGDGTQKKPWATIQKAVDMCPMFAKNNSYYRINIMSTVKEYEGDVNIYNMHTRIIIENKGDDGQLIKGCINIINCNDVTINYVNIENNGKTGINYFNSSGFVTSVNLEKCNIEIDRSNVFIKSINVNSYKPSDKGGVNCKNGGTTFVNYFCTDGNNTVDMIADAGTIFYNMNDCEIFNALTFNGGNISALSQNYKLFSSVTGSKEVKITNYRHSDIYVEINHNGRVLNFYAPTIALDFTEGISTKRFGLYSAKLFCDLVINHDGNKNTIRIENGYYMSESFTPINITEKMTLTVYAKG